MREYQPPQTQLTDPLGLNRYSSEIQLIDPYSVSTYSVFFTLTEWVENLQAGRIAIPHFPWGYRWSIEQASRLIESLLLDLPIPRISLFDQRDHSLLVIDGQHRLKTIQFFYEGQFNIKESSLHQNPFRLTGIQPLFEGATYQTLSPKDRSKLDRTLIEGIVISTLDTLSPNNSILYYLFERLNPSTEEMSRHELRATLYDGTLNILIQKLNLNVYWRLIHGQPDPHLSDQELILRVFALYSAADHYHEPLTHFLNEFMASHRTPNDSNHSARVAFLFEQALEILYNGVGNTLFQLPNSKRLNPSLLESALIGLMKRIDQGEITHLDTVHDAYFALVADPDYQESLKEAGSSSSQVKKRLELAIRAFAEIP